VAHFTNLEVSEISGDLIQPERSFFLTFSVVLIVDDVDVGMSAVNSPHFLARPGPPAKVLLNTKFTPAVVSLAPLPVSPVLYVADKNGNLVASPPLTIHGDNSNLLVRFSSQTSDTNKPMPHTTRVSIIIISRPLK
jgi:hypothetical protein